MTEDFLSRWSRLKRESATEPEAASEPQPTDPVPAASPAAPAPAIDASSLPAIESISAESDVAAFLQAGVPEDLRLAALRSAWACDPAIRDFIGIAESQWDFNTDGAIAGFGSLSVEEHARYVAARALQDEPRTSSRETAENARSDETATALGPGAGGETAGTGQPDPLPAQESIGMSDSTATPPARSESDGAPPHKRTHGSALPR